jgi:peptidyl-prolyl cis-trans isomerase A (cyclophilin A)
MFAHNSLTLTGRLMLFFVAAFASALNGQAQTEGIYADFTTSMGSYTCRLEYAIAPKACANFIGLATGLRPWLDLNTGRARTDAFYKGILFHRVVSGFVIQAGSRDGLGDDGPGYFVPDEITPALRFTNAWMLAMANSGTNSNGSQFFITVASHPELNDGYTIFGEVTGGTNVVQAINSVAVANERPLTNITIQSVNIRRVGATAQAFDINAQGLPLVTNISTRPALNASQIALTFSNRLYADNELYYTTNLAASSWNADSLGIEVSTPQTNTFYKPRDASRQFYRVAQIQYASSTFAPKNVYGRTMTFTFLSGASGVLTNTFNAVGTGTFGYTGPATGAITSYNWYQEAYRGSFYLIFYDSLPPMYLQASYAGNSGGVFTGTVYPNYPYAFGSYSVAGTFTSN